MHVAGLGHSHVVALAKGAYALQMKGWDTGQGPLTSAFHCLYDSHYKPAFPEAAGERRLNPVILAALHDNDPDLLLLSMGGNEHNVLSIAQADPLFDFILGEDPDLPLDEACEILPESVIRETLRAWMTEEIDLLCAICAASTAPKALIEPPPPLPRAQVLAYPGDLLRSALDKRRISPDLLRHKMWRVQTGVLKGVCCETGIRYVRTPAEMIDQTGLLGQAYCGRDATHANDHYGEIMVVEALRKEARS